MTWNTDAAYSYSMDDKRAGRCGSGGFRSKLWGVDDHVVALLLVLPAHLVLAEGVLAGVDISVPKADAW